MMRDIAEIIECCLGVGAIRVFRFTERQLCWIRVECLVHLEEINQNEIGAVHVTHCEMIGGAKVRILSL